jgi:hypothetical protein
MKGLVRLYHCALAPCYALIVHFGETIHDGDEPFICPACGQSSAPVVLDTAVSLIAWKARYQELHGGSGGGDMTAEWTLEGSPT